jgi:Na+-transporting NADH:ubiquinone oxidoreductase subunit A
LIKINVLPRTVREAAENTPSTARIWADDRIAPPTMTTLPDHDVPNVPALAVALSGADYPGLRIKAEVAVGDAVAPGQVVFRDARRPAIAFASPVHGRVSELRHGPRRTLSTLMIMPEATGDGDATAPDDTLPEGVDLRAYLLARGAWPGFVARPFGGPPNPDATPVAIIVSAVHGAASAVDPQQLLANRKSDFSRGLVALTSLTEGTVHLCTALAASIPVPTDDRIVIHRKRLSRGWQSASGQVARLHPARPDAQVWTIGYQDVVAIGTLLQTGRYDPLRSVSLSGIGQAQPRVMRVPLGADLRPLLDPDATLNAAWDLISGPADSGRIATYLGRHHTQAGLARRVLHRRPSTPQPMIPLTSLGRAVPVPVPVVPLMRALSIGDAETCARLGCLDLLEEDVAPLSALCASGTDYGRCLRSVLDDLQRDAA